MNKSEQIINKNAMSVFRIPIWFSTNTLAGGHWLSVPECWGMN
jgi:hypothetical protein